LQQFGVRAAPPSLRSSPRHHRAFRSPSLATLFMTWYNLESELGPDLLLDVPYAKTEDKTVVWIYKRNGSEAQMWRFDDEGRLENKCCPGLALDVSEGNTAERTKVWMFTKNDTPAQKWKFTPSGELESELNGMVLDVAEGEAKSETQCWTFPKNGTPAQRWKMVPVDEAETVEEAEPVGGAFIVKPDEEEKEPEKKKKRFGLF